MESWVNDLLFALERNNAIVTKALDDAGLLSTAQIRGIEENNARISAALAKSGDPRGAARP